MKHKKIRGARGAHSGPKVCANCGKVFEVPDYGAWVYKRDNPRVVYYCRYNCMIAAEKKEREDDRT